MNQHQQTVATATAMQQAARAVDHEDRAIVQMMHGETGRARGQWLDASERWESAAALIRNAGGPAAVARDYATRARQATRHADAARAAVEVTR
jgi:hypothetical protein